MAEKNIAKAELKKAVALFNKAGQIDKTVLTIDWMDNYVAKFHPEKLEEYAKKCASIPPITVNLTASEKTRQKVDIKKVREYFIGEFFPELTDEKVKERKKAEKASKKKKKEEKKKLSPEEKILEKLKRLQEEK